MSEICWPTYSPSAGTEATAGLAAESESEIAAPAGQVGPEPTVAEDYHCYFM